MELVVKYTTTKPEHIAGPLARTLVQMDIIVRERGPEAAYIGTPPDVSAARVLAPCGRYGDSTTTSTAHAAIRSSAENKDNTNGR